SGPHRAARVRDLRRRGRVAAHGPREPRPDGRRPPRRTPLPHHRAHLRRRGRTRSQGRHARPPRRHHRRPRPARRRRRRGTALRPLVAMPAMLGFGTYLTWDITQAFAGPLAVGPDAFTAALHEFARVTGGI